MRQRANPVTDAALLRAAPPLTRRHGRDDEDGDVQLSAN